MTLGDIALIIAASLCVLFGPPLLSAFLHRFWPRLMSRDVSLPTPARRFDEAQFRAEYTPNERTNEPAEPVRQAQNPANPPLSSAFALNPDELVAVARMIEHKTTAEKPTKASIIWAGFGLKKGDSAKYKRASEIYDALFVVPPSVILYPDPENGGRVPASYPVSGRRT